MKISIKVIYNLPSKGSDLAQCVDYSNRKIIRGISLLLIFSLFPLIKAFPQDSSIPPNLEHVALIEQASAFLNHANTYYCYGRSKKNLLSEFLIAEEYLDSLSICLSKINSAFLYCQELKLIERKAEAMRKTLQTIIPLAEEKVNGRVPLFMELMFKNEEYEGIGRIEENVIDNTLDNLFSLPYPNLPLGKTMYYDILLLKDPDTLIYEIASEYVAAHTNHYLISLHELSEILHRSNHDNMAASSFGYDQMDSVARYFNTNSLRILTIRCNDKVNGIYYYSAEFSKWTENLQDTSDIIYAEGYSHAKDLVEIKMFILAFVSGICLIFIITLVVLLSFIKRSNKRHIRKTIQQVALFSVFSLLAGTILLFVASFLISKVAPGPEILYLHPSVRYGWQLLLGFSFIVIPVIINYLILIRFSSETVHKQANLFAFISGSLLASPVFLCIQHYYKYESLAHSTRYLALVPVFFAVAWLISGLYRDVFNLTPSRKKKETGAIILLFLTSIFIFVIVIQNPGLEDRLYIIFCGAVFIPGILLVLPSRKNDKQLKTVSSKETRIDDITSLRKYFANPTIYIPPSIKGLRKQESEYEVFDALIKMLFKSDKDSLTNIATLVAPAGNGKTRFLKELQRFADSDIIDRKIQVYYADCEQNPAGNVPFEPFVQAFGHALGVNSFLNPKAINATISKHIENAHIETISAFASLISGKKDELSRGASEPELAEEMLSFLKNNCLVNSTILIIEDLQWIDKDSASLFEKLLTQLVIEGDPAYRNLSIIVTIRSEEVSDFFSEGNQNSNKFINCLEQFITKNRVAIKHHRINDFLILTPNDYFRKQAHVVRLDYQSTQKLQRLIEPDYSPLYVNELLINIIDKNWIKRENNLFVLSEDARLEELPPPGSLTALISEQISGLDRKVLELIEIAAFIGTRFYSRIVAYVRFGPKEFEQNLLEVYYLLQEAEKMGIIKDDTTENDAYEFTNKQLIMAIRNKYRRDKDDNTNTPVYLYQVVREYYKRIFNAYIHFFKDQTNTNPELFHKLAMISRSLDLPENYATILKYNELTGDHLTDTGNSTGAIEFYEYLADEVISSKTSEERFRLLNKLYQAYLDVGIEKQRKLIVRYQKELQSVIPPSLKLKYVVALQRTSNQDNSEEVYTQIGNVLDEIEQNNLTLEEAYRARFYRIHSLILKVKDFSERDETYIKWRGTLTDLVHELQSINSNERGLDKLFGEVLNTLALSYARTRPPLNSGHFETGLSLLDTRLKHILKEKSLGSFSDWDERMSSMKLSYEYLQQGYRSLDRHDGISLKYLSGYYRELLINGDVDTELCISVSEMALAVNRLLFDYMGICLSIDPLSNLYRRVGRESEATDLLEEGLRIAQAFGFKDRENRFKIKLAAMPIESQKHCRRHFIIEDNESSISTLLEVNQDEKSMSGVYEMPASKFFTDYASDPLQCLSKIREDLQFGKVNLLNNGRLHAQIRYSEIQFAKGIGYDSIIPLSELNESEKQSIQTVIREGSIVKVLKSERKRPTWCTNLIVELTPDPVVVTMFPGELAPPFPDEKRMTSEEFEAARIFWDENLFLT